MDHKEDASIVSVDSVDFIQTDEDVGEHIFDKIVHLYEDGHWQEAEKQIDLALQANSNNEDLQIDCGTILQMMGLYEKGEKLYESALEAKPDDITGRSNYGILLLQMNHWHEAEEQFKIALKIDPNYVYARYFYGILLLQMNHWHEAEEHIKFVLNDIQGVAPGIEVLLNYGNILAHIGRFQEIEKQLETIDDDYPSDEDIHMAYGDILAYVDWQKAKKQYKFALEIDPTNPENHFHYGLFLLNMNFTNRIIKFTNLKSKGINEVKIASDLWREKGDKIAEHLSLAIMYEELADIYYDLKDYKKSGEHADMSGDKYIEVGKYADDELKSTSMTKGYALKGRANIRKLKIKDSFYEEIINRINIKGDSYEIKTFTKIMDGLIEASEWYKKAAEESPERGETCTACSTSMICLSDMLDYMLAVIKKEEVSNLENEIKCWENELLLCAETYKGNEKGEAFLHSLETLMSCIKNLEVYKKSTVNRDKRAFDKCIERLYEVAMNIEGPLQQIIKDSANKMGICRRKYKLYSEFQVKSGSNNGFIESINAPSTIAAFFSFLFVEMLNTIYPSGNFSHLISLTFAIVIFIITFRIQDKWLKH